MNSGFSTFRQRTVQNSGGAGTGGNVGCNVANHTRHIRIAAHKFFNLADGAERSRMVSTEFLSDVVEGEICELPHEVHGDLPRHRG